MPPKDQDMFDVNYLLDSIDTFTESVEAHFESVARSLQDTFRQTPWIPDAVKPRPPPPSRTLPTVRSPAGYFEVTKTWISEHRAVTAAILAFVGTGALIVWRGRRYRAKRRARRTKSGARTEVVVLYGSPHSPLTRALSLDLERKGYIVYIPVSTLSEEQLIQAFSRPDIRPLSLDITSPSSTHSTIQKLHSFLTTPRQSVPGIPAHTHHLKALIFVPSSSPNPPTAITSLTPSTWADVLASHILAPFTTITAFVPLLTSQSSTLLFLTPSITSSSIFPPDHATESAVQGAMSAYIHTLRHEISPKSLNIAEIKLGHFDMGTLSQQSATGPGVTGASPSAGGSSSNSSSGEGQGQVPLSRADLTKLRLSHHRNPKGASSSTARHGTPLRVLHNAVFDAIESSPSSSSPSFPLFSFTSSRQTHSGTTFVGQGSRLYDFVGRWFPPSLVGTMMMMTGGSRGGDRMYSAATASSSSILPPPPPQQQQRPLPPREWMRAEKKRSVGEEGEMSPEEESPDASASASASASAGASPALETQGNNGEGSLEWENVGMGVGNEGQGD